MGVRVGKSGQSDIPWLDKARVDGLILSETVIPIGPPPPGCSEAVFTDLVIALARRHGWRVAHFRPARVKRAGREIYETPVSADGKGFPDLIMVRTGEILVAELKVGKNRASDDQVKWLDAFREADLASGVWRPEDWDTITKVLGESQTVAAPGTDES